MHKAAFYMQQSAETGYPAAQSFLGFCYYNGEGVKQDAATAMQWFKAAAAAGDEVAAQVLEQFKQ